MNFKFIVLAALATTAQIATAQVNEYKVDQANGCAPGFIVSGAADFYGQISCKRLAGLTTYTANNTDCVKGFVQSTAKDFNDNITCTKLGDSKSYKTFNKKACLDGFVRDGAYDFYDSASCVRIDVTTAYQSDGGCIQDFVQTGSRDFYGMVTCQRLNPIGKTPSKQRDAVIVALTKGIRTFDQSACKFYPRWRQDLLTIYNDAPLYSDSTTDSDNSRDRRLARNLIGDLNSKAKRICRHSTDTGSFHTGTVIHQNYPNYGNSNDDSGAVY